MGLPSGENQPPRQVEAPTYTINLKCGVCDKIWNNLSRKATLTKMKGVETEIEVKRNITYATQIQHEMSDKCTGTLSEC
jgi:hypothetical protein